MEGLSNRAAFRAEVAKRESSARLVFAFFLAAMSLGLIGTLLPRAEAAEPKADTTVVEAKAPAVEVVVDPRVELLSAIFRLAGNPEYGRGKVAAYTYDVEKHFDDFREHDVIKLAKRLRRTRGVSYDAVMSMAVHVTDAFTLEEKVPFDPRPDGLDARWPLDGAREFLGAARRFVEEASFEEFVEEQRPVYEAAESRMRAVLEEHAHLQWFDNFFGERPQARFTVALGLLNGGACYGAHCRAADGREELFCVLGVWKTDEEGLPRFNSDVLDTIVHEFCHSYTNAIVDARADELEAAGKKIFPHVQAAMKRQAYGHWKTMMYESLVRACVLRYTRKHSGMTAAWLLAREQKKRQFLWVPELSNLLGEYEADRDTYPTLDAFAPKIVAFFDAYAEKLVEKRGAIDQERPKVVSITPANGATDVDANLGEIRVVFDRPMKDNCWSMVGGGPHFPRTVGKPSYDAARTVWTVPVELKPDWSYRFMLNSGKFNAFRSAAGEPLAPVQVKFKTAKARKG